MRRNREIFIRRLWGAHGVLITLCLFLFFCPSGLQADEGRLRAHFLNVGYGDAIFFELPDGEALLVDAGPHAHAGRVADYLSGLAVPALQTVVLTHPHENHFGGFGALVGTWPISRFLTNGDNDRAEEGYEGVMVSVGKLGIPVTVLREGDELTLGKEVKCSVMHPPDLGGSGNENALVLWVVFRETAFLLTSDIQVPQQEALLERYPQLGSANVVQVPHHGGKISDKFAAAFTEDTVLVVSTGENEYGKPFAEDLEKLKGRLLRTDQEGVVIIESDGEGVRVIDD